MVVAWCLGLAALRLSSAWNSPFYGDEAVRLSSAAHLVVGYGNRLWLPFAQLHVWLLHTLGAPIPAFRIVPAIYFLAAMLLLASLYFRSAARPVGSLLFLVLLLTTFAMQPLMRRLSTALYQEIFEIALFFALLRLNALSVPRSRTVFWLAMAGIFTRESFWIYLLAAGVINGKRLLHDPRRLRAYLFLCSMIPFWLSLRPVRRWLDASAHIAGVLTAPLMMEPAHGLPSLMDKLHSVALALWNTRVALLLAGAVLAALLQLGGSPTSASAGLTRPGCSLLGRFTVFSVLSLTVIYATFAALHPFAPPVNSRLAVPLMYQLMIWYLLLFLRAQGIGRGRKNLSRAVLCLALLLTMAPVLLG